jgi:hypothetical protein
VRVRPDLANSSPQSTSASFGGAQVQADDVDHLLDQLRALREFDERTWWGLSLRSRQIRWTVAAEIPAATASRPRS